MVKIKHLVVDSGAFIKNVPLQEYAENIYTVDGAIKEIRDKDTRQRLQFLPYTLRVKEPTPDAYKHVLEFSKKTGDFATLSATDLQIIALTYQLEKENLGTVHLKAEPSIKVTGKPSVTDNQLSGFYFPKQVKNGAEHDSSNDLSSDEEHETKERSTVSNQEVCDSNKELKNEGYIENETDEKSSDTDDEGWITSKNIEDIQKKMGTLTFDENLNVCVACITTDFAVQNVLLQIGLNVTSVEGMLIKNARVFILRCYACYKTTSNMSKQFCPNCGNKTLKRVSVTYNEEGSQNIHINFRKPINIRGTRYSLPLPKGGKHAVNPILCEDQPIPHNRPSKMALKKIDALSPDFDALSSPFALNDIYSRAAHLGIRSNKSASQKKNPNEWSIRTGSKKRT